MTEQDIIDAKEYADIRWSDADVPLGWLAHFVEAIVDQFVKQSAQPTCKQSLQVEQPSARTGDCLLVGVCAAEGHKIQPAEKRNFCQRCGKRLGKNDWDVHTCTPPEGLKEKNK